MTQASPIPHPALAALGALLFVPAVAHAQECVTDEDCPKSFVCEVTGGSTCPGIACPPNEPCPPPPACETVEYRSCVPGPCASDADCAEGMACRSETYEICTGTDVACAPGETCPPPAPTVCTPETVSQCVYPHELPCTVDADCGQAFQCLEQESCWCDGGGASDPVDPGFAPAPDPVPPPEPTCGCEPSGEFACVAREINCADDTGCPSGWTCEDVSGGGVCTEGIGPDGQPLEPVCTTEPSVFQCIPPSSGGYGYDFATGTQVPGAAEGDGNTGGTDGTSGDPEPVPGAPSDPAASDPSGEGNVIDSDPASGNSADPGDESSDVSSQGASESGDSGGCSVSPARPTSGLAASLALLAGLAAGLRRRNRR